MEQIIKERYEGKLKPGELDEAYIHQTYKELTDGAAKGYGNKFNTLLNDDGDPSPEVIKMRQNLFRFSMAKDAAMLQEINQYLSGGKEVMRFEEFREKVLKLNKKYNLNYLKTEWRTAVQAGKHAADWEVYERMKEIYPNLEYRTQGDDRVRDEHRALEGIIAPIDSDFWAVHYPPNGWNCRCYVVQTAADPTDPDKIPKLNEKQFRPEFRINVGKTGQIFKESDLNDGKAHPYFALANEMGNDIKTAFELAKRTYAPHTIYKGKNAGKVKLNIFADKGDLFGNFKTAKSIVNSFGKDILIRPHLNIAGEKNPEFEYMKIIGDKIQIKSNNIKRAVSSAFDNKYGKNGQLRDLKESFIVIDMSLHDLNNKNLIPLAQQTWSKFQHYKNIKFLIVQHDDVSIKIDRSFTNKNYTDFLKEVLKMKRDK